MINDIRLAEPIDSQYLQELTQQSDPNVLLSFEHNDSSDSSSDIMSTIPVPSPRKSSRGGKNQKKNKKK